VAQGRLQSRGVSKESVSYCRHHFVRFDTNEILHFLRSAFVQSVAREFSDTTAPCANAQGDRPQLDVQRHTMRAGLASHVQSGIGLPPRLVLYEANGFWRMYDDITDD
jgi:hypothetical protein